MPEMSIAAVASVTRLTSRTLRHYEQVGLLQPSRVASNGYRYYGDAELARLYRIMTMRELGWSLATIRDMLTDDNSLADALEDRLRELEWEQTRVKLQSEMVQSAFDRLKKGTHVSIQEVFQSFNNYKLEIDGRERWGDEAWERSQQRRDSLSEEQAQAELAQSIEINAGLRDAAVMGADPAGETFQALVAAHHRWVTREWGDRAPNAAAYAGLAELYVTDERFAEVYGGVEAAGVIRDAIGVWIATNLTD